MKSQRQDDRTLAANGTQPEISVEVMLDRPDLTRDGFSLLYARLVEERFGGHNSRFAEDGGLIFEGSDGYEHTVYLENAWRECQQGFETRSAIVERYVACLKIAFEKPPFERHQIVAIVRDAEYLISLPKESSVPQEHLAADLWVLYAIDRPKSITTMSLNDMNAVGLSPGELRLVATENLTRLLPSLQCVAEDSWFMVTGCRDFAASVLLFDFVWEQLAEHVSGDLVAVVPARDVLLFTGSESEDGLQEIRRRARYVIANGNHTISNTLLRRVEGRWVNFD